VVRFTGSEIWRDPMACVVEIWAIISRLKGWTAAADSCLGVEP